MTNRMWLVLFFSALALACSSSDSGTNPTGGDSGEDPGGTDPTGQVQLSGEVQFNGTNISTLTNKDVSFWVRSEETGASVDSAVVSYDSSTGRYEISGLPDGKVGISTSIAVNTAAETLPGNYRGWTTVDLDTLSATTRTAFDLSNYKIIHMTAPWDNSAPASMAAYATHATPVTFTWEAITGVTSYSIGIEEYGDNPYALIRSVQSDTTPRTQYVADLPASTGSTHYEFSLYGYNSSGQVIAQYMTTYDGGYGWDYRFRTE